MVSITHLLNRTVSIKRIGRAPDGQGGWTESPTTVSTPKARRSPASGSDRFAADREDAVVTHVYYMEADVDVRKRDTIVDGGTSYEVLHILPPSIADYLKVLTREFQHGKV